MVHGHADFIVITGFSSETL